MKQELIETFLSVANTRSMIRSSEQLFITQGACSLRIKQLEEELGVPLIIRGRGLKYIELTQQGYAFLDIARQYQILYDQSQHLKNMDTYTTLNIVANDMLNTHMFIDVYREFNHRHKDILLNISTSSPSGVYESVESGLAHIGFSSSLHSYEGVSITPLIKEKMVFVGYKDHPFLQSKDKRDLDFNKEIYVSWNNEYALWHDAYTNTHHHYIVLHTASMVLHFLDHNDLWCIVPESVIYQINNKDITYMEADDFPTRTIYMVEPKNLSSIYQEPVKLFKEEVIKTIKRG